MKIQIARFSSHQNAKVLGVLMALSSLVFVIPMILLFSFLPQPADGSGNTSSLPAFVFLLFPIMYLVMGYIMARVGCALYNFMYKYIGGFEFESQAEDR